MPIVSIGNFVIILNMVTCAHKIAFTISSFHDFDKYELTLGYHSLKFGQKVYQTKATEYHIHPNYTRNTFPKLNDIALVKMQSPINSIKAMEGEGLSHHLKIFVYHK